MIRYLHLVRTGVRASGCNHLVGNCRGNRTNDGDDQGVTIKASLSARQVHSDQQLDSLTSVSSTCDELHFRNQQLDSSTVFSEAGQVFSKAALEIYINLVNLRILSCNSTTASFLATQPLPQASLALYPFYTTHPFVLLFCPAAKLLHSDIPNFHQTSPSSPTCQDQVQQGRPLADSGSPSNRPTTSDDAAA